MENIASLILEKGQILDRLSKLTYGSVEIRATNGKKYIYVHYRESGMLFSKYVGEYTLELNNLVLENNRIAKQYKKRLREIKKILDQGNYIETKISPEIGLNIDLARRNLVDSIYKQSILEGIATTYSDTETLINGGKVNDMNAEDVTKVVNLKRAWEFILSEGVVQYPSNYAILCQINAIVQEGFSYTAGKIRTVPVTIGGCQYIPPLPFEEQVKEELVKIMSLPNVVEASIQALLYIMKRQIFLDGNKRTAVLFANHHLIKNGKGLIVIPVEEVTLFKKLLVHYYETDEKGTIINFLENKCLTRL